MSNIHFYGFLDLINHQFIKHKTEYLYLGPILYVWVWGVLMIKQS